MSFCDSMSLKQQVVKNEYGRSQYIVRKKKKNVDFYV